MSTDSLKTFQQMPKSDSNAYVLSQEGMEWTIKLDPARKGKRLDLELGIGV